MTNRSGNFVVRLRWIDKVKRDAKRVDVKQKDLPRPTSGEAWELVCYLKHQAATQPRLMIVALEVYEDDELKWTEI